MPNKQLVFYRNLNYDFSITGEGEDGLICVRFGMVTAETDVEELLNLVVTTGKEVEESSRFLESLTEIVKKGRIRHVIFVIFYSLCVIRY